MDLLDGYDILGRGGKVLQDSAGDVQAEAGGFEPTIVPESEAGLSSHRIHETGCKARIEDSDSAGISHPWESVVVILRSSAFIASLSCTLPPQVEITLPAGNHVMKLCILMVVGSFDANLQGVTISVSKVQ